MVVVIRNSRHSTKPSEVESINKLIAKKKRGKAEEKKAKVEHEGCYIFIYYFFLTFFHVIIC